MLWLLSLYCGCYARVWQNRPVFKMRHERKLFSFSSHLGGSLPKKSAFWDIRKTHRHLRPNRHRECMAKMMKSQNIDVYPVFLGTLILLHSSAIVMTRRIDRCLWFTPTMNQWRVIADCNLLRIFLVIHLKPFSRKKTGLGYVEQLLS